MPAGESCEVVVVGGGTVGAWCAYFLRRAGVKKVVLIEQGQLGQGASSRAAGIVRSQGGTPTAVHLAEWSKAFYRSQAGELGVDSGFVQQGYLLPAFDERDVREAGERLAMQQALGLAVRWVSDEEAHELSPVLAPGCSLGATYLHDDGYLDPPRNVLAYAAGLARVGVEVRERVAFTGLEVVDGKVVAVSTTGGRLPTAAVVLTGGPEIADVGRRAGISIPAGGARHQVAVTEPHPALDPDHIPMVFDLRAGLYWRPCEGGLLFGMSNPLEEPGEATVVDWSYLQAVRRRLAALVPVTAELGLKRVWAATIDYTPDHLPILGPGLGTNGPIDGVTVASAGGHGMMWGPAVARCAADLALEGTTAIADTSILGLDRFDESGRSRLGVDPIALPFPDAVAGGRAPQSAPVLHNA